MLERAVTRPATPSYPRVSAQLQVMLEAVLTGRLGPGAAAKRTAEMIAAITGLPIAQGTSASTSASEGRPVSVSTRRSAARRQHESPG